MPASDASNVQTVKKHVRFRCDWWKALVACKTRACQSGVSRRIFSIQDGMQAIHSNLNNDGPVGGQQAKKIFPAFLPLPSQFNFLPVSILPLANFFFSFYHPIFFQNGESFLWPRRRLLTSNNDRQRRVFYRGRRHRREPRKQVLPTDHAHWRSCASHLPLQVLQAPWQARACPATLCL